MEIKKEEFIKYGIHKYSSKKVGVLKTEYENGTIEYIVKNVEGNECYTFPTPYERRAIGDLYSIAYSEEYWEKVKDIPKQNMEKQRAVALEWEYGGIPMYVTTNNEFHGRN